MQPADSFARRLDARVADALDQRLVDRVSSGRSTWLPRAVAFLLVTPVHLLTLVFAGAGVTMLLRGDGWWPWLMGALLLAFAWLSRPRLDGGASRDSTLVEPAQAPELTALVGEVACLLGTRVPTEIRIDSSINAHVAPRGLRGRQLVLGAPLWVAHGPQARVALLGHELGHLTHGDLLSLRYVGSAYDTLDHWIGLLDPRRSDVYVDQTALPVHLLLAPPRWLVVGYLRLLVTVNAAARRRQELYADLSSALAAGTVGAVDSLEVGLAVDAIDTAANRAAIDPLRPRLAEAIAERMTAYDAGQRAGARRRGADDKRSIDASHPPTVDRLRLVESVEPAQAAIVLDEARCEQIDKELAPYLDQAFKRLGDHYRYAH